MRFITLMKNIKHAIPIFLLFALIPDIVLTISKENNKLFGQPTGQPKLQLQPVSETDFVIPELNAKLSFIKGDNGKIARIKLNLNGVESELPRID